MAITRRNFVKLAGVGIASLFVGQFTFCLFEYSNTY